MNHLGHDAYLRITDCDVVAKRFKGAGIANVAVECLKAIPFDAPALSGVKLNHRNQRCTFEAIIEDYALDDPALQRLGLIVRTADIRGEERAAIEGMGLRR